MMKSASAYMMLAISGRARSSACLGLRQNRSRAAGDDDQQQPRTNTVEEIFSSLAAHASSETRLLVNQMGQE